MVYRTYKFRMYPNAEQRQVLARYFGSVRFIYNHYLAERKRQYEESGRSDNYAKQAKRISEMESAIASLTGDKSSILEQLSASESTLRAESNTN